jgi:hypothetical protein
VICRHYAMCMRNIGRTEEAANIIVTAIESCRNAAKRAKGEGLELIKLEESLLLLEGGRLPIEHCDRSSVLRPRLRATIGQNTCPEPRSDCSVWPKSWTRGTFSYCCRDRHLQRLWARLDEFADFEFAVTTLNSSCARDQSSLE